MRAGAVIESVENAVRGALGTRERVLLAVSGGLDSMTLLHAAGRTVPQAIGGVANFDHGTGPHAVAAAALVADAAASYGFPTIIGRAAEPASSEAAWRAARWRFLHGAASAPPAVIVTAHNRDDQVETVLMRVMRGAGARGIAGLYAGSAIVKPLLGVPRVVIAAYAAARGIGYVDDPGNASRAHFRNRVRLDLLPALRAASPSIEDDLLDLARRAAAWRRELDFLIDESGMAEHANARVDVATAALAGYDTAALQILWPALAGRAGAVLDRRGTRRLAAFTTTSRPGATMQLSGGWEALRRRDVIVVRRADVSPGSDERVELGGELRFGRWYFRVVDSVPDGLGADSAWVAELPANARLTVREWRAGDRLVRGGDGKRARRVKRFLGDAGIAGPDRRGWPVVQADDEIIWIPGVRRSDAATVRSGRPAVLYVCEHIDR